MNTRIIPKEKCILLQRAVEEKTTKMGFIIPEAVGEAQPMVVGKVITMGLDEEIDFHTAYGKVVKIKDGQRVLFERGRGTMVYVKGEECIYIPLQFVTALLDDYE